MYPHSKPILTKLHKSNSITSQTNSLSSCSSPQPKPAASILKGTQFLSNLQNYLTLSTPILEVDFQQLGQKLDPTSLCKVIVQTMYLLQISALCRLKVWVSEGVYVVRDKINASLVGVFKLYCFETELREQNKEMGLKEQFLQHRFMKVFQQEENIIDDFLTVLQNLVQTAKQYYTQLLSIQKQKQPQPPTPSTQQSLFSKKFLNEFIKSCTQILLPQKTKITEPRHLLKFLQQLKLFRSHSVLVRLMNCSLVYGIKLWKPELVKDLRDSVDDIRKVMQDGDKEEFKVVRVIDNFFARLCHNSAIQVRKSLNTMSQHENAHILLQQKLSLFDYDQDTLQTCPTIIASLWVPQQRYLCITPQLLQCILSNCPLQNLQPQTQFPSSKSQQIQLSYIHTYHEINLRCITEIDITLQNMDYLNYLIAMFNQNMHSLIFIDTIEKFRKSISKRVEKVIVFKMKYTAQKNEEPLTKMLEMIDVAILAARIFLAELSKRSFIKPEEYSKRQTMCEIFRHYENILRNITRKFYQSLSEQKNS